MINKEDLKSMREGLKKTKITHKEYLGDKVNLSLTSKTEKPVEGEFNAVIGIAINSDDRGNSGETIIYGSLSTRDVVSVIEQLRDLQHLLIEEFLLEGVKHLDPELTQVLLGNRNSKIK